MFVPGVQCEWLGPAPTDPYPGHFNVLGAPGKKSGLEAMAVMVKTSTVGEVLAVLSLTPSDTGAVAATTTWKGVFA